MITLTLEKNHISEDGRTIPDLSTLLNNLPRTTEIALILKTHGILYHLCPLRQAVPFLKSGEFSSDHWVGEKALAKSHTLVGGICPSPFMRSAIHLLANHPFALKGIFLWADLVTQAYGALPSGWALILHNHHLMVCQDGILRVSRPCSAPFMKELPTILRYLKRFGYQDGMSLTLIGASAFTHALPSFIRQETRVPLKFSLEGFTFHIPELTPLQRLYDWPRTLRKTAYAILILSILGSTYFSWKIKGLMETKHTFIAQMSKLPKREPIDETKMEAFATYCHLLKDQPTPLPFFRHLIPFIKEDAIATYFHWSNTHLTFHLEFKPSVRVDQFLLILQSQLPEYLLAWKPEDENPLKGILTIEKQVVDGSGR